MLHIEHCARPRHRKPGLRSVLAQVALAVVITMQHQGAVAAPEAGDEDERPNIVLMLSDNLGLGEIGVYGGGVLRGAPTPRLDQLAAEGMRFTNFNVEVECTPSRSALMTGRMPVRSGTWRVAVAGLPGGLAPWEETVAEALSTGGYDTAMLGKWHLGDSPGRYPTDQGFDSWWGFPFSTNVASFPGRVGFDPKVSKVPVLMEAVRSKQVRETEPYTIENRPLIDQRIAEKARTYIEAHTNVERPFFLFVSWSLMHHPYLPHPDFVGRSGNGPFADMMVEHDHRVGQVLDAIESAGLTRKTLVIYASDNGPDAADFPVVSNSGPYRGYLGSAYEGSIRTPLLVRWPGQVPAGVSSNEIVSMVDLFPTLARLAGAEVPGDREIDGRDQSALLLGRSTRSARESVLVFSGPTLLAVKWRRFKLFFTGDDPAPRDRHWERLWAPRAFNVEQDPREENDIATNNLWLLEPAMREVYLFLFSLEKEGLILPGEEEPEDANVEIPFQTPEQLERSMSAIRWSLIKSRVKSTLGAGDD